MLPFLCVGGGEMARADKETRPGSELRHLHLNPQTYSERAEAWRSGRVYFWLFFDGLKAKSPAGFSALMMSSVNHAAPPRWKKWRKCSNYKPRMQFMSMSVQIWTGCSSSTRQHTHGKNTQCFLP